MLAHTPQDLLQARVHGDRNDGVARHHDFTRIVILKFEQRLDGILFETVQVALMTAGTYDELEFLRRVSATTMGSLESDPMRDRGGRSLGKVHERPGDAIE